MSEELRKSIRWDRPCYKCRSNYCDLSCPDPTRPVAMPVSYPEIPDNSQPVARVTRYYDYWI